MKKLNLKALKKILSYKDFSTKVTYIILFTILLLCFCSFFFYQTMAKVYSNDIIENNKRIQEKIEYEIEIKLYNYLYENLHKFSRSTEYSLFFQEDDTSKEFFTKLRLSMIDSVRNNIYLEDIVLYRIDDDAVISAKKSGHTFEGIESNFDDLKSYAITINKPSLDRPIFFKNSNNKVVYLYPVIQSNRITVGAYRGLAALYIANPNNFFKSNIKSYNPKGTLVITSPSSTLYTEGSNILSEEILLQSIRTLPSDKIVTNIFQNLKYSFYYGKSPNYNINYIYYQPKASFFSVLSSNSTFLTLYIFSNLGILLSSTLAYLFILFSNKRETMYSNLKNDYEGLLLASEEVDKIELVIEKFLKISKRYTQYGIILIHPNAYSFGDISPKQKVILHQEYKEISKKYFQTFSYPNIISLQNKEFISCVINYDSIENITSFIKSLALEFRKFNNHQFNIYHAFHYKDIKSVSNGYIELVPLLKYSYLYDYDKVFSLDTLKFFESNDKMVEPKAIETIQTYLAEFKCKHLMEYIDTTLVNILKGHYSYDKALDFYTTFLLLVRNFFQEKSIDYPLSNIPTNKQLSQFNTLKQCLIYVEDYMNRYVDSVEKVYSNTNKKYLENILIYIDTHIDELTLTSVSEEFHVTAPHLSRVFKEHIGINFSDYVCEKKLLKAARLLKENQDLNINQLANILGYNTPSYFSSKFKERFGVTPATYRKEIINIRQ